MKKIARVFLILFSAIIFIGCGNHVTDSNRVSKNVLTGVIWQPNELRALEGNVPYYYKRGDLNDWNLDAEYVKFNADGTGTYGDANGTSTTDITWIYTNTAKTSLQFIIKYPIQLAVNWENIIYTPNCLFYRQYLLRSDGTNSLASGTRVAK